MRISKLFLWMLIIPWALASCNKDDVITEEDRMPVIELDSPTGAYTVKTGRELLIQPSYSCVENALYVWTIDGKIVGDAPEYLFSSEELGEVFIKLDVSTRYGTASEEMRVDVVDLEIPTIGFAVEEGGYKILVGHELVLKPTVAECSIPTTFKWSVNGEVRSEERDFTFVSATPGNFNLRFETENEDGSDAVEFKVEVCTPEQMPFGWTFDQKNYYLSQGRRILLKAHDIENALDATYTWSVDGEEKQTGDRAEYVFESGDEGEHRVVVTMKNSVSELSEELIVTVCPPEGRYHRAKGAGSRADFTKVYSFLPAPGQFVNEGYTASTMEEATAYAEQSMRQNGYVSLGGFGGSIVVGFDHSVDNSGNYDLAILGNSFTNSSEPGIVWVMQDENGDGLPNDTWYELKGSESGKPTTLADYSVTYFRPKAPHMSVQWKDNLGNSGTIDYLGQYHGQPFYYPAWVKENQYTLRGTRLGARNTNVGDSGNQYWENADYDWGYADNFSPTDRLEEDPEVDHRANHFKISHAVDFEGKEVNLKYIDFVKVQNAVNAKSGWLGELSTEVCGFYDFSLKKK